MNLNNIVIGVLLMTFSIGGIILEKLVIKGGTRLTGDVTIGGAKNAAVAILPATLLIKGVCTLTTFPV